MTVGLSLYRILTRILAPFVPMILAWRVKAGKEDATRQHERLAEGLPKRPDGPLIWLHGASVGESLLLVELAESIATHSPTAAFLFTCQTLTAAQRVSDELTSRTVLSGRWTLQSMAPIDTPGAAKRFANHWKPDLVLVAEGDIWPNLLCAVKKTKARLALINARMTDKSIAGWARWPTTARYIFSLFDALLASDARTYRGLTYLSEKTVQHVGNLKSALPPPAVELSELQLLRVAIGQRPILLAASTHEGEEALIIDSAQKMSPQPFVIIAPRHPERGDWIEKLLEVSSLSYIRRSQSALLPPNTDALLADTMGDMGLWYRLADTVYLGGGHTPGVGGHNPMEALRLGKPVMSGPSIFNFTDMMLALERQGLIEFVGGVEEIVETFPMPGLKQESVEALEASALDPMSKTLDALAPLLPDGNAAK